MKTRLVLASASPARLRTLRAAGLAPDVIVSDVDESCVDSTDPAVLSTTLARLKARAVADRLSHGRGGVPDVDRTLVVGCDSVLAFDGQILGKPYDPADARKRWRAMRGQSGVLHTGHCVINVDSGRSVEGLGTTRVHFAMLSDAEIDAYVASGEPLAVAGAFTIDGLGGPFVERIEGDPGTVIGVSLPLLRTLLRELGISVTELWSSP